MWVIKIISDNILSKKERDFIAELIDSENHKVVEDSFILHDILEDEKSCEVIVECGKTAVINLVSMLKDNIQYKVLYSRINA